ncbi:MAG: phosphotriesterase [Dehalococcoidia bacterium]
MAMVNSVLGPLNTADFGFTLPHEHTLVSSAGIQTTYPEFIDRQGTIDTTVADMVEGYAEGIRTIVDMTTLDLGRDIRAIEEMSRQSGIQIIACTGIWRDIPRAFWTATPDMIANLFVREIEEGIEETGIKAGIIKVANDKGGVTPEGEIILRAAARAHKRTGVPITTHTWAPERVGDQQIRIFEDEGVDLNRVYIGHCNDTTDIDYLVGMLRKGVWLGFDRYPGGQAGDTPKWEERTETVKKILDAGYEDRIMVSHDWSVTLSLTRRPMTAERRRVNPDSYLFITRRVLPYLLELGASPEAVRKLNEDNPRRFFEGG